MWIKHITKHKFIWVIWSQIWQTFKFKGTYDYDLLVLVPVTVVSTVVGMLTHLPCNITPGVPGDRVLLVLWYKDGYTKPIYSFDLRNIKEIIEILKFYSA